MNFYAHEKIQELEFELKNKTQIELPAPRRRPIVGGLAATAGHLLHLAGEGLESWSAHQGSEHDGQAHQHSAH
jgi:hypothetical protein